MIKILANSSKSSGSSTSAESEDDNDASTLANVSRQKQQNGSIRNGQWKSDDEDEDDDQTDKLSKSNKDPDYIHPADFDDDDDDDDGEESQNDDDADFTVGRQRISNSSRKRSNPTASVGKVSNFKKKKSKSSSSAKKIKTEGRKAKSHSAANNLTANHQNHNATASNTISALITPNGYEFEQILPPELLVRIFCALVDNEREEDPIQTLIRLAQVCDHWRNIIITTPILWSRLNLSGWANNRFPLERFRRLHKEHRIFSAVRHLDLSNWKGEQAQKILEFITQSIAPDNDLYSLSIRNCQNISNQFLQSVVANATNLRSLNVSRLTASHQNCQNPFSNTTLKPLLERCGKTLRALYMAENMMASFSTCLALVMEHCPNLEVLDLSNAKSMGAMTVVPIEKLQQCCPKLRVLRAGNISFSTAPGSVAAVAGGWPDLEELSMPFNENLLMSRSSNDLVIEQLTKASENLQVLDIRGSLGISPRGLVKIPAWSLRHLSIAQCPKMQDDSLEMVFQKWSRSLVDIDLSWNKSETCLDACIRALCDVPKEELKLRTVDLTGSAITAETLRTLIMHCGEQLWAVDLQSCRSLPRGMKRLFVGRDCQQLRQIITERCD